MPLLSVIVPTYNRAYCLPRAIDSALRQRHCEIEVIVIDDGSSDGTGEMIAQRYARDARVRYLRQDNAGVSAARNTGLRAAQGDYIALLDSDDYWEPWKCELQIRCLEAIPDAGMIWTDMEAIGPDGKVISSRYLRHMYSAYKDIPGGKLFSSSRKVSSIWPDAPPGLSGITVSDGDIFSMMVLGNLVHTSTAILRRERFEKVKEFSEDLKVSGEDYDFHLRTCREGVVAFVDVSSIQYQVGRADQLTSSHGLWVSQNFLKSILPVIEKDRARITLSQECLDNLLAGAHAWAGEEMLNAQAPGARSHLWQSLKLRRRSRTAILLAASFFPGGFTASARAAYRATKRALRPKVVARTGGIA